MSDIPVEKLSISTADNDIIDNESITQKVDTDIDFHTSTGYHQSFIITTFNQLLSKSYSESLELTYTALWDSTTNPQVTKLLNQINPDIYLPLINNLFDSTLNPRLFEITAGILTNILADLQNTKININLAPQFLDLIESVFIKIELAVPECYIQLIRLVHTCFGRFSQGINWQVFIEPCLFLLTSSVTSELITNVIDLLYTIREASASDSTNSRDSNTKITYPLEPFLEALKNSQTKSCLNLIQFS